MEMQEELSFVALVSFLFLFVILLFLFPVYVDIFNSLLTLEGDIAWYKEEVRWMIPNSYMWQNMIMLTSTVDKEKHRVFLEKGVCNLALQISSYILSFPKGWQKWLCCSIRYDRSFSCTLSTYMDKRA